MGAVSYGGVIWGCYSRFAPGSVAVPQNPVRIPRPKIDKLACQAQDEGIFAKGEYPGSAPDIN